MKPAIEVKGISKSYIINHKNKASYSTLKDDLANVFKRPLGLANQVDGQNEEFWALNDVSFEVPRGEIFGIIGKNGSGKSTMLKILSRIVEPTKGSVTMRGRTASLLEVGTGFHPELTGRENIYFNGSMLGMSRQEINRKFNEIVEFSEIEKFLDTPVKFYSSGMYVRLAFSVAAHLEPDILILDEVLAVGDAGFQKKSLDKIRQTMQDGRTVLFVSHSIGAVQDLCTRGILLKDGQVDSVGDIDEVIEKYIGAPPKPTGQFTAEPGREGKHEVMIQELSIRDSNDNVTPLVSFGEPLELKVELHKKAKLRSARFDFNVFNQGMSRIACFTNDGNTTDINSREFTFRIEKLPLAPGIYVANVSLLREDNQLEDFIPEAIRFEVKPSKNITDGASNAVCLKGEILQDV